MCSAVRRITTSTTVVIPNTSIKIFAFLFPVWDVLFGTFCLPNDNSQVKFGLGGNQEAVYTTCLGLYVLPLKNGLSQLKEVFLPQAD